MASDLKIETLGSGSSVEENTGGIVNSEIYIAPTSAIDLLPEPDSSLDDEVSEAKDYVTVSTDITFKTGFAFTKFKAILEKNGFESNGIGGKQARANENKLTINVVGSGPELAGWLRRYKNDEFVVLFKTVGRGDFRMLGSNVFPASILENKAVVGETVEGDAMRTLVFHDKQVYEAPYYTGARDVYPVV